MDRERTAEGVEHLQRAAHELISAARVFLDAAEELVEDRDVVREVVGLLGGVAREFGSLGSRGGDGRRPFEADLDERDADGGDAAGPGAAGPGQQGESRQREMRERDHAVVDLRNPGRRSSSRVRRIDVE